MGIILFVLLVVTIATIDKILARKEGKKPSGQIKRGNVTEVNLRRYL